LVLTGKKPIALTPLHQFISLSKDLNPETQSGHFKIGQQGATMCGLSSHYFSST
jgi:hypothetical protein